MKSNFCCTVVSLLASTLTAHADVQLHPLFSDDMVLQREKRVPVWGTATEGEKVIVTVGNQSKRTQADAEGNWRVHLDAMPVARNLTMTVQGKNEIALKNIAVGDVYLCAGQSNMEMSVQRAKNPKEEIAAANYPDIRLFKVPPKTAGTPQKNFGGPARWDACTPQTVTHFSAVGYYFGRELHQRLNIPIGLIAAAWGGTIIEAWSSPDSLLKRDDLREATLKARQYHAEESSKGPFAEQMKAWWRKNDKGSSAGWSTPNLDDAAWPIRQLPLDIGTGDFKDFDGVIWYRKEFDIPAAWAGKDLVLHLRAVDVHTAYFNGTPVGSLDRWVGQRIHRIPANLVKAGRNVIALQMLDTMGFYGGAAQRIELATDPNQSIALNGNWKYQISGHLKDLEPQPKNLAADPNHPAFLFNGMITPLVPFAMRGVAWYQGGSNIHNPAQYRTLFPEMIRDWRAKWGAKQDGSEFGFYFVQQANWKPRVSEPVQDTGWVQVRDAQLAGLQLPRTGVASAIDVGEANDIHPKNKQAVGKRLALIALAKENGQKIEYSGPMMERVEFNPNGNRVTIYFKHARGLKTRDGEPPRTFAIQSEDGKWHHATALIEGEKIVIWNDGVLKPVAVRYAWASNPNVNLVNAADLPAVPFRTDTPKN